MLLQCCTIHHNPEALNFMTWITMKVNVLGALHFMANIGTAAVLIMKMELDGVEHDGWLWLQPEYVAVVTEQISLLHVQQHWRMLAM